MKRIAVPYKNDEISERFGRSTQFKFYDVDNGKIYLEQIVDAPPKKGHMALAAFLKTLSANVLICGRIGEGGQQALKAADIEIYPGIRGNADAAVRAYLAGILLKNKVKKCDHH